jgi:hypothetical protein
VLSSIRDAEVWSSPWDDVSRPVIVAWSALYTLFLCYAASNSGKFLFIDSANLVVHESGHLLLGWFGKGAGLWGGTILQWAVPLLLAAYFGAHRQTTAFAFCLLFFFENWLYTAVYMADARSLALPLVTAADSDFVEHDWHTIFSSLGILNYDTTIAAIVRIGGWCGMVSVLAWLVRKAFRRQPTSAV